MAIQPNRPQNRVFLVVGIVIAAIVAGLVLWALSRSNSSSGPTVDIVVSAKPIPAGTTLTTDLVTTETIPQNQAPADPITNVSDVQGKALPIAVGANTPITQSLLNSQAAAAGPGGAPITKLNITKGYVAMAIGVQGQTPGTTAALVSVGFYIQPEDHIDILVDPGNVGPSGGIRYAFQDVRVLKVGSAGTAATSADLYIIELPRGQAELMTALITGRGTPGQNGAPGMTIVKFVLRPKSEYGSCPSKPDPGHPCNNGLVSDPKTGDYVSYTPNYEQVPANGQSVPATPGDSTVSASTMASAFPK